MKFITRIFAMLFVFAIPMSVCAKSLSMWDYDTYTDEMTDDTLTTAGLYVGLLKLIVACNYSRELVVQTTFYNTPTYTKDDVFNITTRFDKHPAFDMKWKSQGGRVFTIFVDKPHERTFIKNLRKSKHVRFKPEQQPDVFTFNLTRTEEGWDSNTDKKVIRKYDSTEPLDRVLRDCGRDELID